MTIEMTTWRGEFIINLQLPSKVHSPYYSVWILDHFETEIVEVFSFIRKKLK